MASGGPSYDDLIEDNDEGFWLIDRESPLESNGEVDPPSLLENLTPIDLWDECLTSRAAASLSPATPPPRDVSDTNDQAATPPKLSSDASENEQSPQPNDRRVTRMGYKNTLDRSFFENTLGSSAFCGCYATECQRKWKERACSCGEDDQEFDWVWDEKAKSWACYLQRDQREVRFHKHYSSGTATVRGTKPLSQGQHYWEIKMISPVYGTDMMIGVGTAEADLTRDSTTFCSFLGSNSETWGLSYTGIFHHDGKSKHFSSRFGQGAIIGVHLDTWKGSLSFYKNRKLIGVACEGLKGKVLYPMVSSTAARSGMRMVRSCSYNSSLKYFSLRALVASLPQHRNLLDTLNLPPGLEVYLKNNLSWLLGPPSQCKSKNASLKNCDCQNGQASCSQIRELFLENQISPDLEPSLEEGDSSPFGSYSVSGSRKKLPVFSEDEEDGGGGGARPKRRCFRITLLSKTDDGAPPNDAAAAAASPSPTTSDNSDSDE